MPDSFQGALSAADLQAIWEGSVDRSYREPLLMAGEGGGFEVYTQAFAQGANLSAAIDYTTQQMFIQPWSGQTGEPASGASPATVQLRLTRAGFTTKALVLSAGQAVDEVQNDHGPGGPVPVNTGRRYILQENVVFAPGDTEPVAALAQSERPGYGYNFPLPGSIRFVENAGTGLHNELATLTRTAGAPLGQQPNPALSYTLTALNVTDMFVPANIGQYVLFTSGANEGVVALVQGFVSPAPQATPPVGSGVVLAAILAFEGFTVAHQFQVGAAVSFFAAGPTLVATGLLLGATPFVGGVKFVVQIRQGDTTTAVQMSQPQVAGPAATSTVDVVQQPAVLTPEAPSGSPLTGGAGWLVLDWAEDWQLVVTNPTSPAGGALGMLDLIGAERMLPRHPVEADGSYRDRLWNVADVVTPNAIRRALYGTLGSLPWCYRETGNGLLPGFFYDRTDDPNGDFYDDDMLLWDCTHEVAQFFIVSNVIRYQRQIPASTGPWITLAEGRYGGGIGGTTTSETLMMIRRYGAEIEPVAGDRILEVKTGRTYVPVTSVPDDFATIRRWHVYLSFEDMRGYFIVQVPRVNYGEFGFAYDESPFGCYDAPAPTLDFYDGFPAGSAAVYGAAWNQLNAIRAGGVSFDLLIADGPCV
jgi:hypothetical protein